MTNSDIAQWIDNDEGLYDWWKSSRMSKTAFIRANRKELVESIENVRGGSKPAHYLKYGPRENPGGGVLLGVGALAVLGTLGYFAFRQGGWLRSASTTAPAATPSPTPSPVAGPGVSSAVGTGRAAAVLPARSQIPQLTA